MDRHHVYVAEPIHSNNPNLIIRRTYVSDHNALAGKNCIVKYASPSRAYHVYKIVGSRHVTIFRGKLNAS